MPMLSRELAGASARPIILSILASRESYGYAILNRIEDLSGGELSWDDSGSVLTPCWLSSRVSSRA